MGIIWIKGGIGLKKLIKKYSIVLILIVILSSFISTCYAETVDFKIMINGTQLNLSDNTGKPEVIDGRTLVPLRVVFEALGCKVNWDDKTRTATIIKGDTIVSIVPGNKYAEVNGKEKSLDVAGIIKNGRIMVPLRFISENLSLEINWDNVTKTISIKDSSKDVTSNDSSEEVKKPIIEMFNEQKDKGKYEGDLKDGKCKVYYDNGKSLYIGEIKDGIPNGRGEFYYYNGNLCYQGEIKDWKFYGQGKMYFIDTGGLIYEGEIKDGYPNGQGKMYYKYSGKLLCEGEFPNGQVKIYDEDTGSLIYEGEAKDGHPNGQGKAYDVDTGKLIYEGECKDGYPVRQGNL